MHGLTCFALHSAKFLIFGARLLMVDIVGRWVRENPIVEVGSSSVRRLLVHHAQLLVRHVLVCLLHHMARELPRVSSTTTALFAEPENDPNSGFACLHNWGF